MLLTPSWDKNWDSHSLVNGYPSFYPRIALVAPSPAAQDNKVVHGLVAVTPDDLGIENADGRTRRTHRHKFREKRARTDDCKFLFTNNIIPEWNKLPAELVEAGSLNIFKGRLAAHLDKSCRPTGAMSIAPY